MEINSLMGKLIIPVYIIKKGAPPNGAPHVIQNKPKFNYSIIILCCLIAPSACNATM